MKFYCGLCAVMSISIASVVALHAQNYSGGDGSKANPFRISTVKDLKTLSDVVNGKGQEAKNYEGVYFIQTEDIDLKSNKFIPIGRRIREDKGNNKVQFIEHQFAGIYDGGMHKISNMYVGDIESEDPMTFKSDYVGLFGLVSGHNASIKNVVVASGKAYGLIFVGGIAGAIENGAEITKCFTGSLLQLKGQFGYMGGIVGSAKNGTKVNQCINFSDLFAKANNSFSTGGIVGENGDADIEGCANYGDVYCPSYAGGIVGSYPFSEVPGKFNYPSVKSCYNAGEVTTTNYGAGGIIGAFPYVFETVKVITENCYDYARAFNAYGLSFGPIVGVILKNENCKSLNSYYDKDRFVVSANANDPVSVLGFWNGEERTHSDMKSVKFLQELNKNAAYPYETDLNGINEGLPVFKWINEGIGKNINLIKELKDNYSDSFYKSTIKAEALFPANRMGLFHEFNLDKQQVKPIVKSLGCARGTAWFTTVIPIKDGKGGKYFCSSSFFRDRLNKDGLWDDNIDLIPPADRWLITPEFDVTKENPNFYWKAAAMDQRDRDGYWVYVVDANQTDPKEIIKQQPVLKIDSEKACIVKKENQVGQDGKETQRVYYELYQRNLDLSKYLGKKVRVAFVNNSHEKFCLLVGDMSVESPESLPDVSGADKLQYSIAYPNAKSVVISAVENTRIEVFDITGNRLASGVESLTFTADQEGVFVVRISLGRIVKTEKIIM